MATRALMVVLLAAGVHLLLPQFAEVPRAWSVVRSMSVLAIALAVVAQMLSYVGSGYLLHALVSDRQRSLPLGRAIAISLASSSFGMVVGGVAGVAAATARWLRTLDVDSASASVASALVVQLNNAMVMAASIIGLVRLLIRHELSAVAIVGFALVLATLTLTMAVFVFGRDHVASLARAAERVLRPIGRLLRRSWTRQGIESRIQSAMDVWERQRAEGWRRPLAGAAGNMIFDMLTLLALFYAAGYPITFGVLLVGYGLPLLLGKVTFLPGGIGVVEATMAALYGGLGVPRAVVVVVTLAYRLLSFWIPSLLGFLLIPYLNRISAAMPHSEEKVMR